MVRICSQKGHRLIQHLWCAVRLRRFWGREAAVEVEEIASLMHHTHIVDKNLALRWGAIACHAALKAVELGKLIR